MKKIFSVRRNTLQELWLPRRDIPRSRPSTLLHKLRLTKVPIWRQGIFITAEKCSPRAVKIISGRAVAKLSWESNAEALPQAWFSSLHTLLTARAPTADLRFRRNYRCRASSQLRPIRLRTSSGHFSLNRSIVINIFLCRTVAGVKMSPARFDALWKSDHLVPETLRRTGDCLTENRAPVIMTPIKADNSQRDNISIKIT
jgi:hypothetical protein